MLTRKSGILALVFGAAVLGACENKQPIEITVPPVTPTITLKIAPNPVPAATAVGQTIQLVAVISGTTTQTATWTSSNTACATVNGTTGLVTIATGAANNCTSIITAVSTADATARDAVTITF